MDAKQNERGDVVYNALKLIATDDEDGGNGNEDEEAGADDR